MGFFSQFEDDEDVIDVLSDTTARVLAGKPKPKGGGSEGGDLTGSADLYYYYDLEDQIKRVCYAFLLLSSGFKVLNIAQY